MPHATVRFNVDLTIGDGQFDAFERIARAMIAGSREEPGTLGYAWYLSADRKRCRLLETFADADAVVVHMSGAVVQELVPELLATAQMTRFEVFGDPGPQAGQMLLQAGAEIFAPWRGFP